MHTKHHFSNAKMRYYFIHPLFSSVGGLQMLWTSELEFQLQKRWWNSLFFFYFFIMTYCQIPPFYLQKYFFLYLKMHLPKPLPKLVCIKEPGHHTALKGNDEALRITMSLVTYQQSCQPWSICRQEQSIKRRSSQKVRLGTVKSLLWVFSLFSNTKVVHVIKKNKNLGCKNQGVNQNTAFLDQVARKF